MDLEFKIKLLALYPPYDRVTGPYTRSDGRKHLCLNDTTKSKGDKNKTRTLSYPKALIEVREGRLLLDDETADHIDEDFTNDNIDNLQILSRPANIVKSFELNPERYTEFDKFICPQCDVEFLAKMRQVRGNQLKQKKAGPFCSKSCSGKYGKKVQINKARMVELVDTTVLSTVAKA